MISALFVLCFYLNKDAPLIRALSLVAFISMIRGVPLCNCSLQPYRITIVWCTCISRCL